MKQVGVDHFSIGVWPEKRAEQNRDRAVGEHWGWQLPCLSPRLPPNLPQSYKARKGSALTGGQSLDPRKEEGYVSEA